MPPFCNLAGIRSKNRTFRWQIAQLTSPIFPLYGARSCCGAIGRLEARKEQQLIQPRPTPAPGKDPRNKLSIAVSKGRAPLAFKTRKVSELFRYRNSPEGCTKRTMCIGERDGLGGLTRGVTWPSPTQLGATPGRRHRSLNINLGPFARLLNQPATTQGCGKETREISRF